MYIGTKQIKNTEEISPETIGGLTLVLASYDDGSKEYFSKLLYDKIVTEEPLDPSTLRDRRVFPIVEELLKVLRNWGIKLSELGYMSAVLNESLLNNHKEAVKELWSKWMPRPDAPDDISLVTVDQVLKQAKTTLQDVLGDKN